MIIENIIPSKNSNFGIIYIILILLLIVIGAGGSIYYLYILGYFGSHNTVEDIAPLEFEKDEGENNHYKGYDREHHPEDHSCT